MTAIYWNEKPESATHYDDLDQVFCDRNGYWGQACWSSSDVEYIKCTHKDWGTCRYIARPVENPVYTQEMYIKGNLEVGMQVSWQYWLNEVYIVMLPMDLDGYFVLSNKDRKNWFKAHEKNIKPIDTRTDKQIAIDNICVLIEKQRLLTIEKLLPSQILSIAYDELVGK